MGQLIGVIFTFEEVGDVLPMHRHTELDVHITVIARGRFRVHGPEIGDKIYGEGAVMDWGVGVDHEFVAMTADARVVNIQKNMVPDAA
jgi:quercetin dioxygenase-like cupin family protein